MYVNNINSVNSIAIIPNSYSSEGNVVEAASNDIVQVNSDAIEFSLNYSKPVLSTLDDIKNTFSKTNWIDLADNSSISDYTVKYGDILHDIMSNPEFDDKQIESLTKVLDSSFNDYAENIAEKLSKNISTFFNLPYNAEQIYTAQGTDMGITGEKIINKDELKENIYNMLSASKIFYRNNSDGTKDELEQFLNDKFSETQNINKLSYKDFTALGNTLSAYYKADRAAYYDTNYNSPSRRLDLMNTALSSLKTSSASQTLVNAFEKTTQQNNNYFIRMNAYREVRIGFENNFDNLINDYIKYSTKLDTLKERRKEIIEEHEKEIQKFEEKFRKQMLQLMLLGLSNGQEQIQNMQKLHENKLNNLSKQEVEIENRLKSIGENLRKNSEEYSKFLKSPASYIDSYLNNSESNGQNLEKDSKNNK
ncbi:hypothetical protein [Clostridium sp. 'White wine YQ']|uniref:hypothetical protein n=1 Tax=Clostridium sp. 'White wine YQ' TaxID=3027474 RepID=UPI0023665FD2|nr:hypothetical protein [Clostridium sp. 'White wine YQ']MDD7795408.1 hypothetical protein [Clostridium sp. 'White wine YQ']